MLARAAFIYDNFNRRNFYSSSIREREIYPLIFYHAESQSSLPPPFAPVPPVAGVEEALHNGGRPCARPEKYVFAWGWILILVVQGDNPANGFGCWHASLQESI